jgi:hypothetical protein
LDVLAPNVIANEVIQSACELISSVAEIYKNGLMVYVRGDWSFFKFFKFEKEKEKREKREIYL